MGRVCGGVGPRADYNSSVLLSHRTTAPNVSDGARPFLTKYEHIMVHFPPLVHHLEVNLCVVLVYAYDLVTKWFYASQNPIDCTLNHVPWQTLSDLLRMATIGP